MPPDDDPIEPADPTPEPPAPPAAPAPSPADAVRNSPEYKELEKQNRALARQAGAATRTAEQARAEAERTRLAAEAQSQSELEAQLTATLGEDGLAIYNEIAELSATDPRAAALKMAELVSQARAQNPVPGSPPPAAPAPAAGDPVPPGTPPSPRGLGADAPLGQPPQNPDANTQLIADLEATYGSVVERVANPETRRRVTSKDRAAAAISYLGAAVLKAGARHTTNS